MAWLKRWVWENALQYITQKKLTANIGGVRLFSATEWHAVVLATGTNAVIPPYEFLVSVR